jgi:hypothetical protein
VIFSKLSCKFVCLNGFNFRQEYKGSWERCSSSKVDANEFGSFLAQKDDTAVQ